MKKIICLILSVLMLLSFAACGNQTEPAAETTTIAQEATETTAAETTEASEPAEAVSSFYLDMKTNAEDEMSSAFFAFLNIQKIYSIIRFLDSRKV